MEKGLFCLAFLLNIGAAGNAVAGETTKGFWPEVDTWLRLSSDWRLSMFVPISKNIETDYREGNLILQADYAWGKTNYVYLRRLIDEHRAREMKTMLIRGGYLGARSLDDKGGAYNEAMIFFELHLRTPFLSNILVSQRLRPELRWIGDDHTFSTRWRYRLMVEKEVRAGSISFVPYVNVEPYYDSRYSTVNRVRLIGGYFDGVVLILCTGSEYNLPIRFTVPGHKPLRAERHSASVLQCGQHLIAPELPPVEKPKLSCSLRRALGTFCGYFLHYLEKA